MWGARGGKGQELSGGPKVKAHPEEGQAEIEETGSSMT